MNIARRAAAIVVTVVLAVFATVTIARLQVEAPAFLEPVARLCRALGIAAPEDIELVALAIVFVLALAVAGIVVAWVGRVLRRPPQRA